jgi:sugar phosphate isomerase/epimerase
MQKATLLAAAGRLASATLADAWTPTRTRIELGAQTNAWAIDPARFDTFLGVLDQIKKIGYTGFETGFFNLRPQFKSPEPARNSIAKSGLTFFGIHIAIPFDRNDPATHLPPAALYEEVAHGGLALGAAAHLHGWSVGKHGRLETKDSWTEYSRRLQQESGPTARLSQSLVGISVQGGRNRSALYRD